MIRTFSLTAQAITIIIGLGLVALCSKKIKNALKRFFDLCEDERYTCEVSENLPYESESESDVRLYVNSDGLLYEDDAHLIR